MQLRFTPGPEAYRNYKRKMRELTLESQRARRGRQLTSMRASGRCASVPATAVRGAERLVAPWHD